MHSLQYAPFDYRLDTMTRIYSVNITIPTNMYNIRFAISDIELESLQDVGAFEQYMDDKIKMKLAMQLSKTATYEFVQL